MIKLETSALKDVYLKLQRSCDYSVEVVFIPRVWAHDNPEEYERAVASAPWPVVSKPWLIDERHWMTDCIGYGKGLVVVDEKGSISHKDAMPMILRWGIKACPFSTNREKELRDSEWKDFNFSSQSTLEFIFQNTEIFQSRATETVLIGKETVFLCVGPVEKMLEFLPHLTDALRKLDSVVQVVYIGEDYLYEEKYETKRKEMCSITSLSLCDAYKFWERIKSWWDELSSQGVNQRIVQVRSMVLALVTALQMIYEVDGMRIIAVDEKGEMINGRGEEMVQLLRQSDEEGEHNKLMSEIKSEGFSNVLGKRWAIHHEDHPHHPLVRVHRQLALKDGRIPEQRCETCFQVIDYSCIRYRCSICEKYEMCQKCFERC